MSWVKKLKMIRTEDMEGQPQQSSADSADTEGSFF
jgi:hypothetical protein